MSDARTLPALIEELLRSDEYGTGITVGKTDGVFVVTWVSGPKDTDIDQVSAATIGDALRAAGRLQKLRDHDRRTP